MSEVVEIFAYWQERCNRPRSKLTPERRSKIQARLNQDYTVDEIKQAIDGAAERPYVDPLTGRVFDELTLICRNGSKLESFMARVDERPQQARSESLQRADAYLNAAEYEGRR